MSDWRCLPSSPRALLFSHQVVPDSLWPHGLQHVRLPCLSLSPGVCWNSCPLSQLCYQTRFLSSAVPFSFGLQSFLASGSFPVSQFFASSGQSIGVSLSASVLPMNIQGWLPCWFDLLAVQVTLKSLLQYHNSIVSILWTSAFFIDQISHPYITLAPL